MNINSIYWILQYSVWLILNFLNSIVNNKSIWSSPFSWHAVWQVCYFVVIGSKIQENVQLNRCPICGTRKRSIFSLFAFFSLVPDLLFLGWNHGLLNSLAKLAPSSTKQRFRTSGRLSYLLNWIWALVKKKAILAIIIQVAFLLVAYFEIMSSLDLPS